MDSLLSRAVVGRWHYEKICKVDRNLWLEAVWKKLLGYISKVRKLHNGWFYYHFMKAEGVGEVPRHTGYLPMFLGNPSLVCGFQPN